MEHGGHAVVAKVSGSLSRRWWNHHRMERPSVAPFIERIQSCRHTNLRDVAPRFLSRVTLRGFTARTYVDGRWWHERLCPIARRLDHPHCWCFFERL